MELQQFTEEQKRHLQKIALENIIAHWASNEDLAKEPKIFIGGEGCYVYDIHGKKYLDSFSSLITSIFGHGRIEMKQAIAEQMDKIAFFPNYHDSFTVPQIELAEKLAEIAPGELSVSFFVNSGSEANETALKMARQYHWLNGQPHRYKVIARRYSYHGTTLGVTSYTGFPALRQCVEPLLPGALFTHPVSCHNCELGLDLSSCNMRCLELLEKMIQWENPETISSMIMDPIPGSNFGYPIPPDGYLQGVREICNKYGILLIFDEVQTGFGKTGKWFACENWNVTPDMMSISKALTAGYLPLSVVMTSKKIADAFKKGAGSEFRSGGTYGGHPLSCVVALATIEIMQKERVLENVVETGAYLKSKLEKLYKYHIVGDIRGMGMIWAIELVADRDSGSKFDSNLNVGTFIRDWCWDNGMILRNNGNTLVIAPALVMTKEQVDIMIGKIDKAIAEAIKYFKI